MKIAAYSLLGLALAVALGFVLTSIDYGSYRFWAPKYENARREVFVNTQSYVQGKISYLSQLRLDYETATTDTQRAALRTIILSEANQIKGEHLPPGLEAFVQSLQ